MVPGCRLEGRELTLNQVKRARAAGFEALILTIDYGISSNRSHNVRNGWKVPFRFNRRNVPDLMFHPRWCAEVMLRYVMKEGMPRHTNYPEGYQHSILSRMGATKVLHAMRSHDATWDDVNRLRDAWPGILIVKGIQRSDDAERAVEHGADGIVVSNHGGRLMDASVASMDTLPEIAAAVGDKTTILLDSGVRRGTDIVRALALGAKAVMFGRPTIFGVSAAGRAGAEHVLNLLRTEYMQTLGFVGCRSAAEVGPDVLALPRGSS